MTPREVAIAAAAEAFLDVLEEMSEQPALAQAA